ncbi:MAG TPA: sulfite exporter TauE/SafE family protein [Thermoplasmatales archaeon]|nr:sulfite exporter TauE/SafE family protein [Thermoplasmatales archaeon]
MSEIIILVAFFAAIIDTSLGMCYGTILTPSLVIIGYSPSLVVPAVLLSQLVVDIAGGATHTKIKNFTKRDIKVALFVTIPATTLATIGVYSNLNLPKLIIKSYIGTLVSILGFLTLWGIRLRKSPKGLILISSIAGFNKGFMGGGFGPVVVSGQIIFNHSVRSSVAIGDIAEIPVCIIGLLVFAIFKELSFSTIFIIVCIPAIIGSLIGPHLTVKISQKNYAEKIIGGVMLMLGTITLMKSYICF